MAEVEITLPTVQYGNVKIRATPTELGLEDLSDAAALGVATAVYLNTFTQGFKIGASIDVKVDVKGEGDAAHEAAVQAVKDGLGASEVDEDGTIPLSDGMTIAAEAGRRDADKAPWNSTPAVDAPAKPWENGSAAPAKPAAIDW